MRLLATVIAALVLAAASGASAQEPSTRTWEWEVAVPVAMLSGHTTYHISAADFFSSVASELEFPLEGFVAGLDAQLATRQNLLDTGRVVFKLGFLSSVGGASGTMKDSDWLDGQVEITEVGSSHPGLDIFSTSNAELDALIVDARVAWEEWRPRGILIAPIGGVLYQRFEYDVSNARQVGYGPYDAGYTGDMSGKVLDYRVKYTVPYVGLRASRSNAWFTGSAELWVSPFASASDRDDHLLRGKVSTTEADGSAWQASLAGRVALSARDFVEAQASLTRISATGTQHQRFYAGPYTGEQFEIDSKITSSRTSVFLMYARRL